jgi:hypothetical protein
MLSTLSQGALKEPMIPSLKISEGSDKFQRVPHWFHLGFVIILRTFS